jgi:hypothetical protein
MIKAFCQEIEKIFPRWYDRQISAEGSNLSLTPHTLITQSDNVPEVIRNYIQEQLKEHRDKDAILALAEKLLATENLSI